VPTEESRTAFQRFAGSVMSSLQVGVLGTLEPNAELGFMFHCYSDPRDYGHLAAVRQTFYGVFTGESIGRTIDELMRLWNRPPQIQ
jgi:hypothetical protein